MSIASEEHSEIYNVLTNFVEHEKDCPIRGRYRHEVQLQNMWKLGFVYGATTTLSVIVNRMRKPGYPAISNESISTGIVIPLMLNGDVLKAERKIQEMIASTWAS